MARASKYTALTKTPVYYCDFDSSFTLNPATGNLALVTNENAVIKAIKRLILTDKYEALYQPNRGSKVHALLFDLNDGMTDDIIKNEIEMTVRNEEPRVDKFVVKIHPDDDTVVINGFFTMKNIQENFSFNLILKRAR